jgi:hypothetical protein
MLMNIEILLKNAKDALEYIRQSTENVYVDVIVFHTLSGGLGIALKPPTWRENHMKILSKNLSIKTNLLEQNINSSSGGYNGNGRS